MFSIEPVKKTKTKLDLIQNLCSLTDYTEAHHVCHRENYSLHIKLNTFRYQQLPVNGEESRKKSLKNVDFYVHLN